MFRFFNLNKEESKDQRKKDASSDDSKIREFINEVASEVGVSDTGRNGSPRDARKLGEQIKEEVKKRT